MTCDMSQVARQKGHVTPDMWHKTQDTWHIVNIMQKLQVPSSYGLGMFEKLHVTQDTRHVACDTWHVTLSASCIPLENIKLFGKFQICLSSVKVSNFVEIRFTLYLPDLKMSPTPLNEWQRCLSNSPGYTRSGNQMWVFVNYICTHIY